MSLEAAIKSVIDEKMQDGTVERLIAENLEKGINKSMESLLGSWGDVTKVIEGKIKEVMLEQLSSYDYSEYVVKLDSVLTEILQHTALDHKKMLENFKDLMTHHDIPKVVKLSDIFAEWKRHVSKNVETGELEIDYDDEPSYENVEVTMEVEYEDKRSWSSFEYAKVVFECEKDEELNFELRISKFNNYPWSLSLEMDTSINSLRYLDDFKIYLLKLCQNSAKIEIDDESLEDDVEVDAKPEPDYR